MNEGDLTDLLSGNLADLQIKDFLDSCGEEASTVRWGEPISKLIESLVEHPASRAVYVLDEDGKLLGMISFRDIIRQTNAKLGVRGKGVSGTLKYLREARKDRVEEIMRQAVTLKPSTTLRDALQKMEDFQMNNLPVVDEDGKLVGELSGLKILHPVYCGSE
jgi:CBS-domain-containing membrane protein